MSWVMTNGFLRRISSELAVSAAFGFSFADGAVANATAAPLLLAATRAAEM